jgi:hypothetical protein
LVLLFPGLAEQHLVQQRTPQQAIRNALQTAWPLPHMTAAVVSYRRMHIAPRIDAAFTPCSDVFGTAMRPNPEATKPNRGAIIFYRASGAVKDKPSDDFRFDATHAATSGRRPN